MSSIFILAYSLAYSKLIPMAVGIRYWKYQDRRTQAMAVFFIVSVLLEIVSMTVTLIRGNNLFMTHISRFTEIVMLSIVLIIPENYKKKPKTHIALVMTVLLGLVVELYLRSESMKTLDFMNSFSASFAALYLTVLAIMSMIHIRNNHIETNLFRVPMFSISMAVALYYSTSVLIFAFSQTLLAFRESSINVQISHLIVFAVMSLICAYGFWQSRNTALPT